MQRGKLLGLQKCILRTLNYADIFDYPLKKEEIYRWYIKSFNHPLTSFNEELSDLIKEKLIENKDEYFYLKGRDEIVEFRKRREEWSKEKWEIAEEIAKKLKKIPGIKLIGITGSLAMSNSRKDDDIDLLIITAGNSLWLVRLMVFLFTLILGINRRKPKDREVKNKICFNLFLEENHLKIDPENLFLAHEICQMKPIFERDNIYNRFIKENEWVKKYLPNAVKITNHQPLSTNNNKGLLSFLNYLAYRMQLLYMKPKITNEKVSLHQAFFHPHNLEKKILKEYQKRLRS